MSLTAPSPTSSDPRPAPPAGPPRRPRVVGLWAGVALAVALLAASGGVRAWQAQRFDAENRKGRLSPFPLKQVPLSLGPWEGVETELDPAIARATGSTDHVFRSYHDDRTGVRLGVIILYGPSTDVFIHSPDNCYPAQGYAQVGAILERPLPWGAGQAPFRSIIYGRGEGGDAERQEVYYSWYYGRRWTPTLPIMKEAERIPGMLKVHISRRVLDGEYRVGDDAANPCEDFLKHLLPELERRLQAAATTTTAAAATPAGG